MVDINFGIKYLVGLNNFHHKIHIYSRFLGKLSNIN